MMNPENYQVMAHTGTALRTKVTANAHALVADEPVSVGGTDAERLAFHGGIHYGEFVERLSEEGREATGEVRELAEEASVECEEMIVLGRPEQSILAVAEEVGADPIVLGAESKSGMEHTLIGSVSEEVLRHANRTVLVVGGHPEGGSPKSESVGVRQ